MTKKDLRKIYRARRLDLTATEKLKFDDLLLIQFQRLSVGDIGCLMSYLPIEQRAEINTFLFSDYLRHIIPGLAICYPVINPATLDMVPVLTNDEDEFVENAYGIGEPVNGQVIDAESIDMVIVPLLAFDKQGYRVGYGKGFYDRFLKKCRTDVIVIGFSYFEAIDKIEDTNQFDVPLNYCITPQKLYEF